MTKFSEYKYTGLSPYMFRAICSLGCYYNNNDKLAAALSDLRKTYLKRGETVYNLALKDFIKKNICSILDINLLQTFVIYADIKILEDLLNDCKWDIRETLMEIHKDDNEHAMSIKIYKRHEDKPDILLQKLQLIFNHIKNHADSSEQHPNAKLYNDPGVSGNFIEKITYNKNFTEKQKMDIILLCLSEGINPNLNTVRAGKHAITFTPPQTSMEKFKTLFTGKKPVEEKKWINSNFLIALAREGMLTLDNMRAITEHSKYEIEKNLIEDALKVLSQPWNNLSPNEFNILNALRDGDTHLDALAAKATMASLDADDISVANPLFATESDESTETSSQQPTTFASEILITPPSSVTDTTTTKPTETMGDTPA